MKQNEVLFFLGSVCVVVFAWIAFSILHSSLTSTISGSLNQAIVPIQPSFDKTTIDLLQKRPTVVPQYVIQPQPDQTSVVVSTPTPTPVVPTPTVQPTHIATQGGTLQ